MANKSKVFGTKERPRLVVYRSLRYIHAQLVDDSSNKVLFGLMDNSKEVKAELKKAKTKTEKAAVVGEILAKKAKDNKIEKVVFDRNGYIYHGRVKALAEGARKGGLEF
ncbi:MAG: 50S ribosomal protein L18 [Calditrichae bacterium]|nr:50S ribosomal protein L18 [Calditrichota bacterium]MCB9059785.1 50S ribosomal protein L18 [Calditrichia bacterium]